MKRNLFLTGILVSILVFGTMVVGCTDSKLNGAWDITYVEGYPIRFYKFENGKYEQFGDMTYKGTYTTKGDTITFSPTHQRPRTSSQWNTLNNKIDLIQSTVKYSINGDTLTIIRKVSTNFSVEQKTFTYTRSPKLTKVTKGKLVGVWELENVVGISRNETSYRDEYFKDGTAISEQEGQTVSLTWKLRDGNRLQADYLGGLQSQIADIELSENGTLLTWYFDPAHTKKATYRKKK